MATPSSLPHVIHELFVKYKNKAIDAKESMELCSWIIGMEKVPGFNYKQLSMDGFDFNIRDYNRLTKAVERAKKKMTVSASTELKIHEAAGFATFIENLWNEAKNIGQDTVVRWRSRAIEYGYFDENKQAVRMRDFIEDACNFYVEKRDLLETVEEQIRDLEATCAMFAEMSKPQVLRIVALRSYMEFVNIITQLAAIGIQVPQSIIDEVRITTDQVIRSTGLPVNVGGVTRGT